MFYERLHLVHKVLFADNQHLFVAVIVPVFFQCRRIDEVFFVYGVEIPIAVFGFRCAVSGISSLKFYLDYHRTDYPQGMCDRIIYKRIKVYRNTSLIVQQIRFSQGIIRLRIKFVGTIYLCKFVWYIIGIDRPIQNTFRRSYLHFIILQFERDNRYFHPTIVRYCNALGYLG